MPGLNLNNLPGNSFIAGFSSSSGIESKAAAEAEQVQKYPEYSLESQA